MPQTSINASKPQHSEAIVKDVFKNLSGKYTREDHGWEVRTENPYRLISFFKNKLSLTIEFDFNVLVAQVPAVSNQITKTYEALEKLGYTIDGQGQSPEMCAYEIKAHIITSIQELREKLEALTLVLSLSEELSSN